MMRLLLVVALLCAAWTVPAAVLRCEGHYTYIGLDADTKPTAPQVCDRFMESDTGDTFVWSGSAWVADNQPVTLGTTIKGEDDALNRTFGGPKGECRAFTADGVVKATAGMLISVTITAAEVNDDFLIYDNAAAASGTVLYNRTNVTAGDKHDSNVPAEADNGLYLDVTAADGSAAFVLTVCYL